MPIAPLRLTVYARVIEEDPPSDATNLNWRRYEYKRNLSRGYAPKFKDEVASVGKMSVLSRGCATLRQQGDVCVGAAY